MAKTVYRITSESILKYFQSFAATKEFERLYSSYLGDGFWADLGFDIQQGPGSAIEYANSYVFSYLNDLPELILYGIWWESTAGQIAREKLAGSGSPAAEIYAQLQSIPKDEIIEDAAEMIMEKVRGLAERDYIKYSSK